MRPSTSAALAAVLAAALAAPASAATLNVPSAQYPTINSATLAAHSGDVIVVGPRAGADRAYHEQVVIATDGVSLVGNGAVLQGAGQPATPFDPNLTPTGIEIAANNVTVSGFTVRGYSVTGIRTDETVSNVLIAANTVTDNGSNYPDLYISAGTGVGVSGTNVVVAFNDISGNRNDGIQTLGAINGLISNNRVSDNYEFGLYGGGSGQADNIVVTGNHFCRNGSAGAVLFGADTWLVASNQATKNGSATSTVGADGIAVVFSANITVTGNNATNNTGIGVHADPYTSACSFTRNTAHGNQNRGGADYYGIGGPLDALQEGQLQDAVANTWSNNSFGVAYPASIGR